MGISQFTALNASNTNPSGSRISDRIRSTSKFLLLRYFFTSLTDFIGPSSLKDYNESNIIDAIKSGYPVFASGYSGKKRFLGIRVGYKGGHAWVYDGLIVATKDNKTYNLVHCNWGWGGYKNGYYLSKAFGTNAGATIYDSSDIQAGSSSNYKYNLEYSIVRK